MSAEKLNLIPFEDISFADIQMLVDEEAEESLRLELKKELNANQGQRDPWMLGQKKLNGPAKDDLCKEIVAFANMYGGFIVVGIEETPDHPKRAKGPRPHPIPNVEECAERLGRAFADLIDPPIRNLEVRGITDPDGDGSSGVLVIRVGPSPRAPHGVGCPPKVYARRAANSDPMNMQDIQNMIFEVRSRTERLENFLSKRSENLANMINNYYKGKLRDHKFVLPITGPRMALRCTAVPTSTVQINAFSATRVQGIGRPSRAIAVQQVAPGLGDGAFSTSWRPCLGGSDIIESYDQIYAKWTVFDTGAVEASGIIGLAQDDKLGDVVYPKWFTLIPAQIMLMAEQVRRFFRIHEVEYILEFEVLVPDNVLYAVSGQSELKKKSIILSHHITTDRISIGSVATFPDTFSFIEQMIWHAFGLDVQISLNVRFEEWINQSGFGVPNPLP